MTITEFLLARIAEDQAEAEGNRGDYYQDQYGERMLLECKAKRRIVAFAVVFEERAKSEKDPIRRTLAEMMAEDALDPLKALVAIYSDHPDYRDEWSDWPADESGPFYIGPPSTHPDTPCA